MHIENLVESINALEVKSCWCQVLHDGINSAQSSCSYICYEGGENETFKPHLIVSSQNDVISKKKL